MKKFIIFIVVMFLVLGLMPGIVYAKGGPKNKATGEVSFWEDPDVNQCWVEFNFHEIGEWGLNGWPEAKGKLHYWDSAGNWCYVDISYVNFSGDPVFFVGPITDSSDPASVGLWVYGFVSDGGEPGYMVDYIGGTVLDEAMAMGIVSDDDDPPQLPWINLIDGNLKVRTTISDINGIAFTKADIKADILKGSGILGEGLNSAPGLQKPFNLKSQASENAGKK